MDISVILYLSRPEMDSRISQSLKSAGISVTRINTLSRLHTILHSRKFDAVIVGDTFLVRHCLVPARHLWENRSPVTIISCTLSPDEGIVPTACNIPDNISGQVSAQDRTARITRICSLIRGGTVEIALPRFPTVTRYPEESVPLQDLYTSAPTPAYGKRAIEVSSRECAAPPQAPGMPGASVELGAPLNPAQLLSGPDLPLHRKLKTVLETLRKAADSGADIPAITEAVWGKNSRDRKKDIQIYITRLRRFLESLPGRQYRIEYREDRYRLLQEETERTGNAPVSDE